MHDPYKSGSRKDRTTSTLRALALLCVVLGALATASPHASADINHGVRRVGHSLGTAAREVGHKAKHVGLAIGHAAKKAGLEVGHAAKVGGLAFWHAVKGHPHHR